MIKVAIIGCGTIGRAHARGYRNLKDVEITGFLDIDLTRAKYMADEFGGNVFRTVDEIPQDVKGISVATPPSTHFDVIKTCLEYGFNVFAEKPLVLNTKEGKVLKDIAEGKGLCLLTGFKMRYEPVFQKARELIGKVGRIVRVSTSKTQPYTPKSEYNWVPNVGAMYELSVHDFDLVHWICGLNPEKIISAILQYRYSWPREDGFALLVLYKEGHAIGALSGGYVNKGKWTGKDFVMIITGENGHMIIERPDRIVINTDKIEIVNIDYRKEDPFTLELKNFIDVIEGKASPFVSISSAILATAIVEAAVKAFNERRSIELFEITGNLDS